MDVLDKRSQELFSQYRIIATKLKKRFMKKPNYKQASEEYGKLANAVKNEENPRYAALCFAAMAKCDQVMADTPGEAEAWASAGRQFFLAEEEFHLAKHPSYEENLDAGVQCFLLAIEAHEKQNNTVLAAMYCQEIASKLERFGKWHEALRFYLRAADLQIQNSECYLQLLYKVAICRIRTREYDSALTVFTRIASETGDKVGPFGVIRRRCEISQLFLVLMLQIPPRFLRAEHSRVLHKYSKQLLTDSGTGNLDLNIILQSLILAVQNHRYEEIKVIRSTIWKLLEPELQVLFSLLSEQYNY